MADDMVLVPRLLTRKMLKAICKSMSPERRPTPDYLSVREKHQVRWKAAIDAWEAECAKPAEPCGSTSEGA